MAIGAVATGCLRCGIYPRPIICSSTVPPPPPTVLMLYVELRARLNKRTFSNVHDEDREWELSVLCFAS